MRAAIAQGYRKGFATIVDANVVTAITAMVLFAVATASVRGFALMLLIGTALSMLTAVARDARDPRAARRASAGSTTRASWARPAQGSRAGCAGTTSAGAGSGSRSRAPSSRSRSSRSRSIGLNLGIDFKGGTQITFRTPQPTALEQVREEAAEDRAGGRGHPGPRRVDGRPVHELPDPHRVADDRGAERAPAGSRERGRRDGVRREERLRELRAPDREQRAARDPREPAPDRRLHLGPLPVEVLGRRPRRARARPPDRGRDLRADRARGLDGDGRRDPHGPRLLDVRHDHHLRPHPRERPAHAARVDPRDRERLAVGGHPALARDDVHHAAAGRLALRASAATRSRTSRSRCSSASAAGAYSSIFLAAPLSPCSRSASRSSPAAATTSVRSRGSRPSAGRSPTEARGDRRRRRRRRRRRAATEAPEAARAPVADASARRRPPRSGSAAGSGAPRGRMAEPASERGPLETLGLAGIGAIALVAERADELADGDRHAARRRARRGACRDRGRRSTAGGARPLGSARQRGAPPLGSRPSSAWRRATPSSELELRVAQLEHRLKLLERD